MNIEKADYHDHIENYLDGKLTEEEDIKFQESLPNNPELSEQYRIRILLAKNWVKAKEYENTKQSIAQIIRDAQSRKKNWIFVWSIAASFLILISVSGIIIFTGKSDIQAPISKNTESSNTQLIPQIKYAEEKASLHIAGKLKMISPIKNKLFRMNDSIIFTWNTDVVAKSKIIIEDQKSEKIIYRNSININALKFKLKKNTLPKGEYLWYIEGFPEKEKFMISSSKD